MSRIDDVKEAVAVVRAIVDGVAEIINPTEFVNPEEVEQIQGDWKVPTLSDEFIAQKIFEAWQSIEVTHRTISKGATRFSGGNSSASGGGFVTKEDVYNYIKEKGYGYIDGITKFKKVPETVIQGHINALISDGRLYKTEKGYYKAN